MFGKKKPSQTALPTSPASKPIPQNVDPEKAEDDDSDDDDDNEEGMKLKDLQKSEHKDFLRKKEHWW